MRRVPPIDDEQPGGSSRNLLLNPAMVSTPNRPLSGWKVLMGPTGYALPGSATVSRIDAVAVLFSAVRSTLLCGYVGLTAFLPSPHIALTPHQPRVADPAPSPPFTATETLQLDGGSCCDIEPTDGGQLLATSREWFVREQEVDLRATGLPASFIDRAPPITVSERFASGGSGEKVREWESDSELSSADAPKSLPSARAAPPLLCKRPRFRGRPQPSPSR